MPNPRKPRTFIPSKYTRYTVYTCTMVEPKIKGFSHIVYITYTTALTTAMVYGSLHVYAIILV